MKILIPTVMAALFGTALLPLPSAAQDGGPVFGKRVASVTYGPYVRFELGAAAPNLDGAYWLPPGGSDPRIDFNATPLDDHVGFGAAAFGHDWQNGVRAEVAIYGTGTTDFVAPCQSASNGTDCSTHSDITSASVQTTGLMANVFYAPLEARGSHSIFQPFMVAGVGLATNSVGEWTRTKNALSTTGSDPVRTFEGDNTIGFAWSLGLGAAVQLTRPGRWPVIAELTWRYYDFGEARGGATPVTSGSQPRQPLTFDVTQQVVTLGVRVPLKRY